MTNDWTIRMITSTDAELLSELATAIYKQYYLHLWYDRGAWYLDHSYGVEKLRRELSDLNNFYYVAWSDQQPMGYLKLRLNEKWRGFENQQCLEVERIYVLQNASGMGLGKRFMNIAFEIAKYHNQEIIFLKAMDSSNDALGFYQKMGFELFDTLILPYEQMKPEFRGMVVLKKNVLVR